MIKNTWLTCRLALLSLVLVFFILSSCKKGATIPATTPAGNQFATEATGGKVFADQGPGFNNTFPGSSQGTAEPEPDDDDNDDDEEENPPPVALSSSLEIGSLTYNNQTVNCGGSSSYYAMSVTNAQASFTVTLYFPSKPTSNNSYTVEEVSTGSPGAGKVWCVLWQGSSTYIASSGYVGVVAANNVVSASFTDIELSDGVNTDYLSGLLHCQ